jgi:hypothetical protein
MRERMRGKADREGYGSDAGCRAAQSHRSSILSRERARLIVATSSIANTATSADVTETKISWPDVMQTPDYSRRWTGIAFQPQALSIPGELL